MGNEEVKPEVSTDKIQNTASETEEDNMKSNSNKNETSNTPSGSNSEKTVNTIGSNRGNVGKQTTTKDGKPTDKPTNGSNSGKTGNPTTSQASNPKPTNTATETTQDTPKKPKTVLEVKDLTIKINNTTINYDSFSVDEGEIVLVQGANGSGKSTFFKLFKPKLFNYFKVEKGSVLLRDSRLVNAQKDAQSSGSKGGVDILKLDSAQRQILNRIVVDISQEDNFESWELVEEALTLPALRALKSQKDKDGKGQSQNKDDVKAIIEKIKIEYVEELAKNKVPLKGKVSSLSGGQRKMVQIVSGFIKARALNAKLIILDEPLNNLDYIFKPVVNNFVKELTKTYKIAVMLITHCLLFEKISRHISIKPATSKENSKERIHEVEIGKKVNESDNLKYVVIPCFSSFNSGKNIEVSQTDVAKQDKSNKDVILSVNNLALYIHNDKHISYNSFDIHDGDFVLITGKNGSGKSTFFKLFKLNTADYLKLQENSVILFENENILDYTQKNEYEKQQKLNRSIVDIAQEDDFDSNRSAYFALTETARIAINDEPSFDKETKKKNKDKLKEVAKEYFNNYVKDKFNVSFSAFRRRRISSWSGGQRKMIQILAGFVKAEVIGAKLILMDEPLNNLDYHYKGSVTKMIEKYREKAKTEKRPCAIMIITHCQIFKDINCNMHIKECVAGNVVKVTEGKYTYVRECLKAFEEKEEKKTDNK